MNRVFGLLFAVALLMGTAFAAELTATTKMVGPRGGAEVNVEVNTPGGAMVMVAKGEMNAEGNALRVRTMERNMAMEMNAEGNAVMKQMRGTEANRAHTMAMEMNGTGNARGVVEMTMNMGGNKRLRIMVEQNGAVIEANGIKVRSNVRVRVEGNVMISERSGKPIKVDPVRVVEQVKSQIRAQNVENVELVDDGNGPVYVVQARKQARLLGIIPVQLSVQAEVNAENGAVVAVKQPWWAFLVFG